MARIFVTGGSGFVGGHLIEVLLERGHHVWCASRSAPRVPAAPERLEWIQSDLHDTDAYADALAEADGVLHLAGLLAARRRSEYFSTNVEGTQALLDTCRRTGRHIRRFVYMSSIAAMGPTDDGSLLTEATPCRPRSEYGASKLAAERIIREAAPELATVILRPSFVYGAAEARGATYLRELLGPARSASRLTIRTLSFCHVSDVVRACLLALEAARAAGHVYLVAEPKAYTWKDVDAILERAVSELAASDECSDAAFAERLLDRVRQVRSGPNEAVPGEHWGCDTRLAAHELGFHTLRSLDEAAREVIGLYLQDGSLDPHRSSAVGTEV